MVEKPSAMLNPCKNRETIPSHEDLPTKQKRVADDQITISVGMVHKQAQQLS